MVKQDQVVLQIQSMGIHHLYDKYAAMLLGYIFEVVGDKVVAEEYLVRIFSGLAQNFNEKDWRTDNNWSLLQTYAKHQLAKFDNAATGCQTGFTNHNTQNRYLNKMTEEQKQVFCNIYYRKKTTAQLAAEIDKSEELIKKLLKESFTIIRKLNEN
jgi:DNA-directed RNA polymerase specialized sigma24 family protein